METRFAYIYEVDRLSRCHSIISNEWKSANDGTKKQKQTNKQKYDKGTLADKVRIYRIKSKLNK